MGAAEYIRGERDKSCQPQPLFGLFPRDGLVLAILEPACGHGDVRCQFGLAPGSSSRPRAVIMPPMRADGRSNKQLRPITVQRNFTRTPAGSVLWTQGDTVVLCTASVTQGVPPWFRDDRPGGWITAEYVMLPASTPQRKERPKLGHTDSRGTEIQRIIGRSLRAIIDLSKIGPHTIALDCQVLQADGGTRTASICGAYVALADAIAKLPATLPPGVPGRNGVIPARFDPKLYDPAHALVDQLAAVSVGVIGDEVRLDLAYEDDSIAAVDMNIAFTAGGKFVEVQGSAENGGGFDMSRLTEMLELATKGCREIHEIQKQSRSR
jgi:ribonuclease PH